MAAAAVLLNTYLEHHHMAGALISLYAKSIAVVICSNLGTISSKTELQRGLKTTCVRLSSPRAANLVIGSDILAAGNNLIRPSKVNDRPFLDWLNV